MTDAALLLLVGLFALAAAGCELALAVLKPSGADLGLGRAFWLVCGVWGFGLASLACGLVFLARRLL